MRATVPVDDTVVAPGPGLAAAAPEALSRLRYERSDANHASRIAPAFDDGSTVQLALDAGVLPVRAHLP